MPHKDWMRHEVLRALEPYCTLQPGLHHNKNEDVVALANELGRYPSSVACKLSNPKASIRGVRGAIPCK